MKHHWLTGSLAFSCLLSTSLAALEDDPGYLKAQDALQSGLPEVAARNFEQLLAGLPQDSPDRAQLRLKLAEAWVRSQQAAPVLELFKQAPASGDGLFWQAQALALSGQFHQAVQLFDRYQSQQPARYRHESLRSAVSLLLALDQVDQASRMIQDSGEKSRPELSLLLAEIKLRQGEPAQALEQLPAPAADQLNESQQKARLFLRLRALLAQGDAQAVLDEISGLVEPPMAGATRFLEASAHFQLNQESEALAALMGLISDSLESPYLPQAFDLLRRLKNKENPAYLEKLGNWVQSSHPELVAQALYTRAQLTGSNADLKSLINGTPGHYLADAARLQLILKPETQQASEKTLEALQELVENSSSPRIRAQAQFERARLAQNLGQWKEARESLASIDESEWIPFRDFNLALISLAQSLSLPETELPPELKTRLAFEVALKHAESGEAKASQELTELLEAHPEAPLAQRARLVLARQLLEQEPPAVEAARRQIEPLQQSPGSEPLGETMRRLELALSAAEKDWSRHIEEAKNFLVNHPDSPQLWQVRLSLANAHFKLREFNEAQLAFYALYQDTEAPESVRDNARLLAALAAANTGTKQALQQALEELLAIAESKSPFSQRARLEAARLCFFRLKQSDQALQILQPLNQANDPEMQRLALVLESEIRGSRANEQVDEYQRAIACIDRILAMKELSPSWVQRCYLRRAEIAERAGDSASALTDYWNLLTQPPAPDRPALYYFYEKAGFASIRILEQSGRLDAALKMARRIELAGGPRAEEAAARARQIESR